MEVNESKMKLFNLYDYSEVKIDNLSLKSHICLESYSSYPHTASRNNKVQFGKSSILITERFVCGLMRRGRNSGKKTLAMKALRDAFTIIHTVTGKNPIQVLCDAIVNCGPREDCARIGRGGAMKRTSVDVSPLRRVNVALFLLCKAIRQDAMKGVKKISSCIADVLLAAAQNSQTSWAVSKKDEIERVARSNR